MLSAEDGAADTIVPRLMAAGADRSRIEIIEATIVKDESGTERVRTFSLAEDLNVLEKLIDKVGDVILIIIDPISSYMGRETDSHSNTQVRSVLEPVKELAERRNVGVLCVSHLNKGAPLPPLRGSMARSLSPPPLELAWPLWKSLTMMMATQPGATCCYPSKVTSPPEPPAWPTASKASCSERTTTSTPLSETSRIRWDGETHARVDEVLEPKNGKKKEPDDRAPALAEAKAFLVEVLKDGPRSVQDIKDEAKAAGVAWRTVERAKPELNILSKKEGDCWIWGLPMSFDETDKTANTANTANRQGPKEDGGLDGGVGGRANDADDEVDRL